MVSFANVLEKKEIHTIPNDTIDNGLKGATYIEKQKEIHTLPNDTIKVEATSILFSFNVASNLFNVTYALDKLIHQNQS